MTRASRSPAGHASHVGPRFSRIASAFLAVALGACDFDVSNPGPVQDEFLNDPEAFDAVVNGMGRGLADAMNLIAFHQSMVVRELFPTGGTGQFGISVNNADGILSASEQDGPWSNAQQARWMAEDGLRRFHAALGEAEFGTSPAVAQAYLWAGYANRLLGENMCHAVIDVGPMEPRATYLTRAEENFTNAIAVAQAASLPDVVTAATAGRAAVRVHLGDWPGAQSDAAAVPTEFVYALQYFDVGDLDQYNRIAHAGGNNPYKTHTVWGTVYETYYQESGDPRTPWEDTGLMGDGSVSCCGQVPFYRQLKHEGVDAPINLSSGREMRLIEAEAMLLDGDWTGAMQVIHALRAAVGVAPWPATNAEEAWARLKRERGIELWLEGRRLGDLYRWDQTGTPGALDPKEVPGPVSHLKQQDLCFPIPEDELQTNPNLGG